MSGKFEILNLDMKSGASLKIKGKIQDSADRFAINLGQGPDTVNLHFNPRLKESTIVCNSLTDGNKWGQEQRDGHMCFSHGSQVKITVTFQGDEFQVTLPDGHKLTFPNRLGHQRISYLSVNGLHVSSFKLD